MESGQPDRVWVFPTEVTEKYVKFGMSDVRFGDITRFLAVRISDC